MEESRRAADCKRVSISFNHSLVPSFMNGKAGEERIGKPLSSGLCNQASEAPKTPNQAMEFLCRSWSPSSSEFFNLLSSQILDPCLENEKMEGRSHLLKKQNLEPCFPQFNSGVTTMKNHAWAFLSTERFTTSTVKKFKSHRSNWMSAKSMKALLTGELFTRFIRRAQLKKKEKIRLRIAQVHAALSVARLAAAIAGTVGNFSGDSVNNWSMAMDVHGEGWDQKMSLVVASAAALVATVCAEAAEAAGAQRSLIASAINRGLATHSASEILGLTAAAATCLRGASTLEVRTAANRHLPEEKTILVRGLQLPNTPPTGKLQMREVRIYLKHNTLTLKLVKKILKGTITTHKEYRITSTLEEINCGDSDEDGHGLCSIALGTNDGTVQLQFDNKKQYLQWKTTITHLLCIIDESKLLC